MKGFSLVKVHQKSHLGDVSQNVGRRALGVHRVEEDLPRSPRGWQPSKARDPSSGDAVG